MSLKWGISFTKNHIRALVLSAAFLPNIALAADLYVSASGSDSNPGTQSAPFRTIQKAAGLAQAGTTVHVAPGTYSENVVTRASGTSSARIRYVSDTGWGAKVIGAGTESTWENRGSFVDIVGFDISGSGRLGILNLASSTLISGNHVHDMKVSGGCTSNGGAGIDQADYSQADNDTVGNVVHDIGVPGGCNGVHGIYHSNLRGHIYNNIVYRVSSWGIHLWHAANNVVIMNNTLFANGTSNMGGGMVLGDGDSPGGIVLDNTIVANNIVYNNPFYGIYEYCYSGENCIGANVKITNNLVFGNGNAFGLIVGSASSTISADPQFVNYSGGDYHLKSSSPAIDKGISSNAPAKDMDGNSRPQGAGYDVGAYEFVMAAPSPSPAPAPAPSPSPAPSASVSVSTTQVAPGGTIGVNVSGSGLGTQAYAALYLANAADADYAYNENWQFLNGTKTEPSSPINSATLNFIAPMEVGTYNIRVFSTDAGSVGARLAVSQNIQVVVASDTTAPSTSLTSPANGSYVSVRKYVTIQASASDNVGVKTVEFYVNGSLKCTGTSAPYSCSWYVPRGRGKVYSLQTKAKDAAGNVGSSSIVKVTSN